MSKTGFYKGRLGIGLTSTMGMGDGNPRYPLDINGDIRLTGAIVNSQGLALNMVNPDSAWVVDAANNKISYSAGNVGIGTASPNGTLNVYKSGNGEGMVQFTSTSDMSMRLQCDRTGLSSIDGEVYYEIMPGTTTTQTWKMGTNDDKNLHFRWGTIGSMNNGSDYLTILNAGNVGIGTTSPYSKLQVAKPENDGFWTTGTTAADCHMLIGGNEWGETGTNETLKIGLGYFNSATGNVPMYIGCRIIASPNDTTSALVFGTRNSEHDTTAAEERMCILPSGNVGIGTTSPSSNLYVASHQTDTGSAHAMQPSAIFSNENSSNSSHSEYHTLCGYGLHHIDNYKSSTLQSYSSTSSGTNMYLNYYSQGNVDIVRGTLHVESGKVGIGTTSPDSLFHIYTNEDRGSTNTTNKTMLTIESATTQDCGVDNFNPISIDFVMGDNQDPKGVARIGSLMAPTGNIANNTVNGEASTALTFSTGNPTLGERMRIDMDGNVGIGVIGSATATAGMADPRNTGGLYIKPTTGIVFLSCNGDAAAAQESRTWRIRPDDAAWGSLFFNVSTTNSNYPAMTDTVMTLDDNGNVGIGTTSPDYKLDVAGTFRATGYIYHSNYQYFQDDTNTFRYWDSNNIYWGCNGSANVEMALYQGKLGIGTTSPQTELTVKGSDNGGISIIRSSDNYHWRIFNSTNNNLTFQGRNGDNNIRSGCDDLLVLHDSGKVGIGTPSPQTILDVLGDGTNCLTLRNGNNNISYTKSQILLSYNGNPYNSSGYCHKIQSRHDAGATHHQNAIDFYLWKNGQGTGDIGNTHGMSITAGGVGIGTTSPEHKLDIRNSDHCIVQIYGGGANKGTMIRMSGNNNATSEPLLYVGTHGDGSKYCYISSRYDYPLVFLQNNSEVMRLHDNGNVGIGTSSPTTVLTIKKPIDSVAYGAGTRMIDFKSYMTGYDETTVKASIYCGVSDDGSLSTQAGYMAFMTADGLESNLSERMRIERSGNVGIGTTSPGFPLEISGDVTGPYIGQVAYITSTHHLTTSGANSDPISLKTSNVIWSQGYIMASSDRRIKENIVDVADNLALEMVRNIPVKYYEYKDKLIKGNEKTIGFIAQEVKEIIPMAVSIQKNIIPNEMRKLENISWEEIKDNSDNIINYKLTTDLQDVSGINYKFYVSNDPSGNDEVRKEVVGNHDNSFTFDTSYNNVFCYGKEVDDFHTLDKQKLFALNFSATQELDRKVIVLESENAELKTEVATLKAELAAIKQHLGI